jgi:hypothetical protein
MFGVELAILPQILELEANCIFTEIYWAEVKWGKIGKGTFRGSVHFSGTIVEVGFPLVEKVYSWHVSLLSVSRDSFR